MTLYSDSVCLDQVFIGLPVPQIVIIYYMYIYRLKQRFKRGKFSLQIKSTDSSSNNIPHGRDKTTISEYLEIITETFKSTKFRSRVRSSDSTSSTTPCVNNDQCKTRVPEYAEIQT